MRLTVLVALALAAGLLPPAVDAQVPDTARSAVLTLEEAIPRGVSLFEAHLYQPSRVALLQRRDGYDSDRIEVGGGELRAVHAPGHASDHLCFYLEGAASLFAGDNVLGRGTAVIAPPDGEMRAYLASLRKLRERHISRIYPGHHDPLDGGDQVQARSIILATGVSRSRSVTTTAQPGRPTRWHAAVRSTTTRHCSVAHPCRPRRSATRTSFTTATTTSAHRSARSRSTAGSLSTRPEPRLSPATSQVATRPGSTG